MKPFMRAQLERSVQRLSELDFLLSREDIMQDMTQFMALSREHAEVVALVTPYQKWLQHSADMEAAQTMLQDSDPDVQAMAQEELAHGETHMAALAAQLQRMLLPKDPDDARNAFLEIRAGTGGDESALFGLPEGQRGIFVGGGGTVRIQRVVGTTVMMDMMLTGRLLTATEGLQEKVIRYVTPAGEALTKAKELAHRIAKNSVETNWMIINVLPRIQDMAHDDGLFVEQLNSARARPPEAEARLREFVDGKAKKIQDNQA